MEIIEVEAKEFENVILDSYHVFGQGYFAELNKEKAESVHWLLFKDGKYKLGITIGVRDKSLFSPFSAPFGGFIFLRDDIKINFIDDAILALLVWAKKHNFKSINFTLPSDIYHPSFIAKQANCLFRNGFVIKKVDLNYSFDLKNFNDNYTQNIWYNARKNLKKAFKNELYFVKSTTFEEKKTAYEVIQKNRQIRGFPLRLTWREMEATSAIIPTDFFLVLNAVKSPMAAAIIFHISAKIVQVVYWGDIPEFNNLKTMNFLSYKVFEYYKNSVVEIVDIGPSTENSAPNYGLCEFKESIGCDINEKKSFNINLNNKN